MANVISGAKANKSWLLLHLALSIATGRDWMGFRCRQGRVLLLDYELTPGTIAKRLGCVASAMSIDLEALGDSLLIEALRGRRLDKDALPAFFSAITPGRFDLIILDPLYRIFPGGFDENSNVDMSGLFADMQRLAEGQQAALAIVHHASKGSQADKATADVGAGAGAQSRACDTHIVLRAHEEPDAAIVSAVLRTWPPVPDFAMRWYFPVWSRADDLDPTAFRRPPKRNPKPPAEPKEPAPIYMAADFAGEFLTDKPVTRDAILSRVTKAGRANQHQAGKLLAEAEAEGLAHRWKLGKDRRLYFASQHQPGLGENT